MELIIKKTNRNYLERVNKVNKAESAVKAKQWGYEYWDGSRDINYGGYYYDGRWKPVTEKLIKHYKLNNNSKILDVGWCKGFLLHDIESLLPNCEVRGLDVSSYAIDNAEGDIKNFLLESGTSKIPFENNYFDLVVSLNTLYNLYCFNLKGSLLII